MTKPDFTVTKPDFTIMAQQAMREFVVNEIKPRLNINDKWERVIEIVAPVWVGMLDRAWTAGTKAMTGDPNDPGRAARLLINMLHQIAVE
jgi:hypothetical protein